MYGEMKQEKGPGRIRTLAAMLLLLSGTAVATEAPEAPQGAPQARTASYADGYAAGYTEGYARGYEAGRTMRETAAKSASTEWIAPVRTTASGSPTARSSVPEGCIAPDSSAGSTAAAGVNPADGISTLSVMPALANSLPGNSASDTTVDTIEDASAGRANDAAGNATIRACTPASGRQAAPRAGASADVPQSAPFKVRLIHQAGAEFRPEYILPTNPFLAGRNKAGRPIEASLSAHLRYSLRFRPESVPGRIYSDAYQGVGVARYSFGNEPELGNPLAVYLFQGARIARVSPRMSLNYEWNFGLSFGWKPYDPVRNSFNVMTGSKLNAYLNVDLYFLWMFTRRLGLTAGVSLTHFSNGNTKFPNAGLNAAGLKVGLTCNFGVPAGLMAQRLPRGLRPEFPHHVSYDLTLFGSWRRKGVEFGGRQLPSPEAYPVAGFNFAAMYNFGYKFRAGVSADGVYDGSANVYTEDYIVGKGEKNPGHTFYKPGIDRQLALGLSVRGEFVMPYFTVGFGLGMNVLHKGGDLKSFYQVVTLKIAATRSSFIHIGYCLKDFQTPNYLMLGIGYRFNNRYPRLR